MSAMRAKVFVESVTKPYENAEQVSFRPVTSGKFGEDGVDEDNTYSRYTPAGQISLTITNPALHGQFTNGQTFYVDFTEVAKS